MRERGTRGGDVLDFLSGVESIGVRVVGEDYRRTYAISMSDSQSLLPVIRQPLVSKTTRTKD